MQRERGSSDARQCLQRVWWLRSTVTRGPGMPRSAARTMLGHGSGPPRSIDAGIEPSPRESTRMGMTGETTDSSEERLTPRHMSVVGAADGPSRHPLVEPITTAATKGCRGPGANGQPQPRPPRMGPRRLAWTGARALFFRARGRCGFRWE